MTVETTKILIQFPDPKSLKIKNCVINVGLRFCLKNILILVPRKKFSLERISARGKERVIFK